MKLTEQFEIEISEDKIMSYLLSPTHRIGNHTAEFFERFGFNQNNWKELQASIRIIVENNEAQLQKENQYGQTFRVEGNIKTISGEIISVRTAWMVKPETKIARFITAYPI